MPGALELSTIKPSSRLPPETFYCSVFGLGFFSMEDFNAVDAALDYGYQQGHWEALPLVVLTIGFVFLVQWALTKQNEKQP